MLGYEVRYAILAGPTTAIDPSSYSAWTPAGNVPVGPPDTETDLTIDGLTPLSHYAIGIRARGTCGASPLTFRRILTPAFKYAQLTGCFIATAAFGSDLAPQVSRLRALRDAATARSALARAATDLYYRSSPPLASLIARSPSTRALVRSLLRIF